MKNLTDYVNERGLLPAERALKRKAANKAFALNVKNGISKFSKTAAAARYAFTMLDDLISVQ